MTERAAPSPPSRVPTTDIALPRQRQLMLLMVLAFCAAAAVATARLPAKLNVPGAPTEDEWGLSDFRDAIYYPGVAFLDGRNPYDRLTYLRTYPVQHPFRLYTPLSIVVHLPFALLPYGLAEAVYFLGTIALTPLLAALALRAAGIAPNATAVFGVAALVLASRPGQWNLLLGQCTATVAVGCYAALTFARERSVLAGLGLALATLKPTFGVPLTLLMVARRDFRAVAIGLGVAGAVTIAATAALVPMAGGVAPLLDSVLENQRDFTTDPMVVPDSSTFRLDAPALASRFLGRPLGTTGDLAIFVLVMIVAGLAVARSARSSDPGARRLSASLICLAVLASVYHQAYGYLLATLPLVAAAAGAWAPMASRPALRRVLVALLALPALNYLASGTALDRLGIHGGWWLLVTSLNGIALLLALGIHVAAALRDTVGVPTGTSAADVKGATSSA